MIMAQSQYYEILNESNKTGEHQFFANVEERTVQYVITPDKTQVQFPNQQLTQEQVLQSQIIQQPLIQQPIQLQPQFAVLKDGALRSDTGQQIFFLENAVTDGIVIEKPIQQVDIAQQSIPQPIVLNHQLAQSTVGTVVRGPIMKTGLNQHVSLEIIQKNPQQKGMQRPPNPNQQQIRQHAPGLVQMRQPINAATKSPNQILSQNAAQHQVRLQQQQQQQQSQVRQNLVRTTNPTFRPQQNIGVRQNDPNQCRPNLRLPNPTQQHRPNQVTRSPSMVTARTQAMVNPHLQVQQSQKFPNQGNNMNNSQMKSADDQESVTLPDGSIVSMDVYKNMLIDQKARTVSQKAPTVQQPNPIPQSSPMQQSNQIQQQTNSVQQLNSLQPQNASGQQTTKQTIQNNTMTPPNVRPPPKKRVATPRPPRVPKPKAPPRGRNQTVTPQQQQNSQGHFSMISQQQQQANKIQQPQQFQNQIQMPVSLIPQQNPQQTSQLQQTGQLQQQQQSAQMQQQTQMQQPAQLQQSTQMQQPGQVQQQQQQQPTLLQQQQGQLSQQSQLQQSAQLQQQQMQHQQSQLQQQQQQQLQQQQQQLLQQQQQQQQLQQQQQQQLRSRPSQANYVIQPPKQNQKASQRPWPAYVPSSQIQKIIESTPISEEFSDSIRMLVLLENGEQRLITFTLPKEACTIQEILEQVNVPFQVDTNIQVIETNSDGINYVVTVGNIQNLLLHEEEPQHPTQQEERSIPMLVQAPPLPVPPPTPASVPPPPPPPTTTSVSLPLPPLTTTLPLTKLPQQQPKPVLNTPPQQQKPVEPPKSPSPEPDKEIAKFVPGMLALCGGCGYLSEDFNKCIRCSRKLPDNVKSIPANMRAASGAPKRDLAAVAQAQQAKHQILLQQKANAAPPPKVAPATSPKKKSTKNSKTVEQESVVISSDEEEEEKPKLSENLLQKLGSSVTICPISKEPSTIDIQRHNSSRNSVPPKVVPETDIMRTKLKCRTVRIGSYRCVPMEEVIIDTTKVVILVPHPSKEKTSKTITIERGDIVKVLASFNSSLPVVFYYLDSVLATKVRDELDMTPDSDYYFDPLSLEDEAQRRITLLPDDIGEDTKNMFQLIYGYPNNILEELNIKEANDILIKTCPKELSRSTPGFAAFAEIKQLVTYPPDGRYRITINTEDYICLGQEQFLNDVIIDFYLTYLIENLPPQQRSKIHVFSTFFYRRLTTKPLKASRKSQPSELDPTLTPAQKRHCRVKKWTKNVNIFEKDFVIVPINENAHWFLAIICFPGMIGTHTWDGKPIKIEVKSRKKKKNPTSPLPPVTIKQEKLGKPVAIPCDDPDLSDKDEAEGDDSEMESDDSEEVSLSQNGSQPSGITVPPPPSSVSSTETILPATTPTPSTPRGSKEVRPPIKQPCILIFDSLSGANRCRVVATLRDYLTCEYKAKTGKEKIYNKEVIKGASPKVPQQNNFTDCGLYLLQYVEQFLKDPIKDFHIPIKEIKNWFEEIVVTRKREDIANLIKSLMKENGKDTRLLPDIAFPTFNGKIVERDMEEEEEEEEEEDEMMEEEEEDEESFNTDELNDSIMTLNTSKNSITDPASFEDIKGEETPSPVKPSSESTSSDFITQPVVNPKPDLCEFPRHTNKDTLSILKAKRIIRHKNLDGPNLKKPRSDQE